MKTVSSNIVLRHVRLYAYHGVGAQERLVGQDFDLSLRISVPTDEAARTDQVAQTVSYAEVYDLIKSEMNPPAQLLETVAHRMARAILERWPQVEQVELQLLKVNPPMGADCAGAGVEICLRNDKTREV